MFKRATAVAGLAASLALALGVPAASAAGGPPPPVSTNGHKVQLVAAGLKTPTSFAFGHGVVFEGDGGSESSKIPNGGVYVLRHGTATKIASPLKFVSGLAFHNNKLYIAGGVLTKAGPSWRILTWSGWNGKTFTVRKTIFTGPKGFDSFNGLAFGANGRLYAGVDVGLTDNNDHGPRSTSPHVYEILTFRADGSDMQVFAKGMRQPWQLAFRAGSNSPFVTDLGQDKGAKNPPDFLLHVHAGDDYGFPTCNGTVAANCAGFTTPFRVFHPHTDLMGIAVHNGTLYMTSFLGGGKGGEVFSMGLGSHTLKPLLKGFVAPTVGLGLHNGFVYVGELTGQVFRVKV